jgi:hypothetical protein
LGSQLSAASRFEQDGSILRFGQGAARVSVTVCTPRILRIELAGEAPDAGPSYVDPRDWPGAAIHVDDGEPVRMVTADLGVEVSIAPVRLAFLDRTGTLLLH